MGIFQKVKNILFDEEEDYTSQIKITPEMRSDDIEEEPKTVKEDIKKVEEKKPEVKEETSERELFKADSTFPFFDFDEKEFNRQKPQEELPKVEEKKPEPRNVNVFEYEKRRRSEKRTDFGRYERTEITETIERKKFKPSPIISPVYGVLNQDYKKDDIKRREDSDNLNVDKVRDKAFGEKKEEIKENPKTTYYEDEETVTITIPEEKERKVKTIDELLEDTSDIVVDVDRDLTSDLEYEEDIKTPIEEDSISISEKTTTDEITPDDIENDTLENDLFDLIDSMYGNDEEGE